MQTYCFCELLYFSKIALEGVQATWVGLLILDVNFSADWIQ